MANVADILTDNLDIWTSAIERRSTAGRGRSKKFSLYGIDRLRALILDLAVRGKLVPQDANDEPVIVNLQRIAVEKKTYLAQQKLPKQKTLAPIGHDVPHKIPSSWAWTRLGTIAAYVQRGKSPQYEVGSGEYVLSQKCVQWAGIDVGAAKEISSGSLAAYEEYRFVRDGDILWNSTGTGTIGRVVVAYGLPERIVCDSHVTLVRSPWCNPRYLQTWLASSAVYGTMEARASGSTNQIELTAELANSQPIPLPSLAEQHRIVAKVDELMALCDRLEAQTYDAIEAHELLVGNLLATLTRIQNAEELAENWARIESHFDMLFTTEASIDQLKQTILQLAVMGKLVPQDPNDEPASELLKRVAQQKKKWAQVNKTKASKLTDRKETLQQPFSLPVSWQWSSPDDFSMKITDGEHFRPDTQSDGVFFLSAKDIREDGVSLADPLFISDETAAKARSRCDPEFGDLLIVSRGATCGRICKVNISDVFCLLGSVILIKPSPLLDNSYLEAALKSPLIHSALISASGATAQGAIYLRDLKKICVPIPPVAEQRRIVSVVNHLLVMCEELKRAFSSAQTAQVSFADAVATQAVA